MDDQGLSLRSVMMAMACHGRAIVRRDIRLCEKERCELADALEEVRECIEGAGDEETDVVIDCVVRCLGCSCIGWTSV